MDIQTATQQLAQYQNAPGQLYFDGLLHIAKYLRIHPYLPKCYAKNTQVDSPLHVSLVAGSGCWLGDMTIATVEAHQFGGHQLSGLIHMISRIFQPLLRHLSIRNTL